MSNEKNLISFIPPTSFSVEFADASTGGNKLTGTISGKYTVIGNTCTVHIIGNNLVTTSATAGNRLYIRNLPFASTSASVGSVYTYLITQVGQLSASIIPTSTSIGIADSTGGAEAYVLISGMASGNNNITITLSYLIAN